MLVDDVQWGYNKTSGKYELFMYGIADNRVIAVEFPVMMLMQVTGRITDHINFHFPPASQRQSGPQPEFTPLKKEEFTPKDDT